MISEKNNEPMWLYFGTRTTEITDAMKYNNVPQSHGIYVSRFNNETGTISVPELAYPMEDANFFATDRKRKILYVTGQREAKDGPANVYAFRIDPKTGKLNYLNHRSTEGQSVCHVSVSSKGDFLTVANYSSGDFAIFPLDNEGRIGPISDFVKKFGSGPNIDRQKSSHGHSSYFLEDQGKQRLLMVDLGADKVYIRLLDPSTGKTIADPDIPELNSPPGSGPRHLALMKSQNGEWIVFILNELDSTLTVFGLTFPDAELKKARSVCFGSWSTLPESFSSELASEQKNSLFGSKTAEIELYYPDPQTPLLYLSNRGHNSIAVFDVRSFMKPESKAAPVPLQWQPTFGVFPRYFSTDPSGRFMIVSNKRSGTSYVFTIDKTGLLNPVNKDPLRLAWPFALAFFPVEE